MKLGRKFIPPAALLFAILFVPSNALNTFLRPQVPSPSGNHEETKLELRVLPPSSSIKPEEDTPEVCEADDEEDESSSDDSTEEGCEELVVEDEDEETSGEPLAGISPHHHHNSTLNERVNITIIKDHREVNALEAKLKKNITTEKTQSSHKI